MKKELIMIFNIKKNKKVILILSFIIILFLILILNFLSKNDGMNQYGIENINYKVYLANKGYSKSVKNGVTAGNYKDSIKDIKINIDNRYGVITSFYSKKDEWKEIPKIKTRDNINAIKLDLYYGQSKNYDICYRTYNQKDKWLGWSCKSNDINGNIKENILAVQIKLIPHGVVKYDYLKDYDLNAKTNIGFGDDNNEK